MRVKLLCSKLKTMSKAVVKPSLPSSLDQKKPYPSNSDFGSLLRRYMIYENYE
jgi:hypothetical protein